jgi:hypothetical protein
MTGSGDGWNLCRVERECFVISSNGNGDCGYRSCSSGEGAMADVQAENFMDHGKESRQVVAKCNTFQYGEGAMARVAQFIFREKGDPEPFKA